MAAVPALLAQPSAPPCPGCPQCPQNSSDCVYESSFLDELTFKVNGKKIVISYMGHSVIVECTVGVQLHDALPRFNEPRAVNRVRLVACDVPNCPYAAVLTALGLRTPEIFELSLKKNATLIDEAFVGLRDVKVLSIVGADETGPVRLAPAALATLELKTLDMHFVSANGLQLPPSLIVLNLHGAGLGTLAATALPTLPVLKSLTLTDNQLETPPPLAAAKSLKNVFLKANRAASPIDLGTVQNLTLIAPRNISALQHCDSLVKLELINAAWLPNAVGVRCPALTSLKVECTTRSVLPTNLLVGAAALRQITIKRCKLARLEHDFLKSAPNVRLLDLSQNKITTIDDDAFTALSHLEEVSLSDNLLREGAADAVLRAVPETLRVLKLGGNRLGDLCTPLGLSPLIGAKLRELSLPATGATRICKDYNDNRYLHSVDLSHNQIAMLNYTNLKWATRDDSRPVKLNLSGNPVRAVKLLHEDYERLRAAGPAPAFTVEVRLSNRLLDCDCDTLWLKLALAQSLLRARFSPPLVCRRPRALLAVVDEKALVCEATDYCAGATGCSCVVRVEAGAAPRVVAVAQCARAGLAAAPRMPPRPRAVMLELNLTDNSLVGLNASDVPEGLSVLDLRGNNVSLVEEAALAALRTRGARLLLARNPLSCGCADLAALVKHRTQVSDFELATCDDGRPLSEAAAEATRCGGGSASGGNGAASWAALGAALAAAALLACGALVAARSPRARVKIMKFLEARGFCVRWASRDDDDDRRYLYDVFLSFSHHDVEFAEQLADRLESGPRPLRLCLHYRDWRAGDWIPAQIARSVAVSRRTVVLLSEHFLASGWARAEFREAYARAIQDSRPRLVIILLGASPPAGLDSEMRHYVTMNTYVRWGETGFWDKLRLALPEPRAAPALPASTAHALSAPTAQALPAPIPQALPANDTKKPAQLALEPAIQTSPCA